MCRRRRRSPQESECESNGKHVHDMMELCRRKLDSKKTLTPDTKATGRGRRGIDGGLEQHDVQASREVAGTGASLTGSASTQFTMFVVHAEETWLHRNQADPENVVCLPEYGLASRGNDLENCVCGKA